MPLNDFGMQPGQFDFGPMPKPVGGWQPIPGAAPAVPPPPSPMLPPGKLQHDGWPQRTVPNPRPVNPPIPAAPKVDVNLKVNYPAFGEELQKQTRKDLMVKSSNR